MSKKGVSSHLVECNLAEYHLADTNRRQVSAEGIVAVPTKCQSVKWFSTKKRGAQKIIQTKGKLFIR